MVGFYSGAGGGDTRRAGGGKGGFQKLGSTCTHYTPPNARDCMGIKFYKNSNKKPYRYEVQQLIKINV